MLRITYCVQSMYEIKSVYRLHDFHKRLQLISLSTRIEFRHKIIVYSLTLTAQIFDGIQLFRRHSHAVRDHNTIKYCFVIYLTLFKYIFVQFLRSKICRQQNVDKRTIRFFVVLMARGVECGERAGGYHSINHSQQEDTTSLRNVVIGSLTCKQNLMLLLYKIILEIHSLYKTLKYIYKKFF